VFVVFVLFLSVGLIWLLMAAPLGRHTVSHCVRINAPPDRAWQALYPFGAHIDWNGALSAVEPLDATPQISGRMITTYGGRDGVPVEREFVLDDVHAPHRFGLRYTADTALDQSHWHDHRMDVHIVDEGPAQCMVTISETDRYNGAAFMVFRFFALRRTAGKLRIWAETGRFEKGGLFEKPATQMAMAGLSALLLWPLFGLDAFGFLLAVTLTLVVALHELGHMAAFRLLGHRGVRMIFIPVLGGVALGGRPYDTKFEVGFAALMGAGFSAFLVAALMAGYVLAGMALTAPQAQALIVFALICALFNLGNLMPVWKFDGGQVIRQLFATRLGQGVSAGAILMCLTWLGLTLGLPMRVMLAAGIVVLVLSLLTAGGGVRPKRPLTPMTGAERAGLAAGLVAVCVTHGAVLIWSVDLLFRF